MCSPRYRDILLLPHPTSPVHRRMTNQERAAQFAPFAALTGYEEAVRETARLTEAERDLGDWEKAELNEKLRLLCENAQTHPRVTVTFFRPDDRKQGGAYVTVSGTVKKIKEWEKELLLTDGTVVPLNAVRDMTGDVFAPLGD